MKSTEYFYDYPRYSNIKEMMKASVEKYAENVAFILKEKSEKNVNYKKITYREFGKQIEDFGAGLFELGLQGKRIAIIGKNRYEWALSYVSILLGDMTAVPLDKGLTDIEIRNSLLQSKADCIIFEEKYYEIIRQLKNEEEINLKELICMDKIDGVKSVNDVMTLGSKERKEEYINCEVCCDEMRILLFTSGTTSASKGVMLTQRNIVENIHSMKCVETFYPNDVNLAFLPYHHTFGSTGQLIMLASGVATAFPDGLRHIAENFREYQVSLFVGVPLLIESIYGKIEKEIEKQGKTKLIQRAKKVSNFLLKCGINVRRKLFKQIINQLGGSMRLMISGAAGLDKEVAKNLNELGIRTIQGYGLTETSPVIAAENDKYIKYGSVGFPMKNVVIEIVDKDENGIGEIRVKGPNVMLGYYENEEATNAVLKDGWFYTGDLGYLDEDGFLFVTGRKKNVIVLKSGKKVFPEELEELVNKIDVVKESMVFGFPKEDDVDVSVKIQYDEEIRKEKYATLSDEEFEKMVWNEIKKINKEMPKYKYMKHMILTTEDFIKTTTAKIKRFEEMKRILEENPIQNDTN